MKTVIEMAREAGFMVVHEGEPETGAWYECFTDEIEAFAALVRADEREVRGMRWDEYIAKAVEAEREACAKVADGFIGCDAIVHKIRARSNT
jgi:methionine synthase II (cobalamin-independent)